MVDTGTIEMDDEEARNRTKKSGSSVSPSPKPVDNAALAAMLRESANHVQNGEFDPILYQTLIDFRAYYKKKLPKKKEKGDEKSKKRRPKKKIISQTTKHIPADKVKNGDVPVASFDDTTNTTSATEPGSPVPETSESNTGNTGDFNDVKQNAADSEDESTEFAPTEPPTESPRMASKTTAEGATPGSPSPSTVQKGYAPTAIFGAFKFPKLHVPMPNAGAFSATSKKNAQRAKADLEEFVAGDLAKQAETSGRRKAAGDEPSRVPVAAAAAAAAANSPTSFDASTGWCEIHQKVNCQCHVADARTDGDFQGATPIAYDDSSFITRESSTTSFPSLRSPENNNATPTPTQTATATSTATKTFEDTHDAAAFVNGDNAATRREATGENMQQPLRTKPAFQRPVNPTSSLVANGWIEQQRRSKMRFVWKEVLASLVQARKPGEETTLWIQREITNPVSGKRELEALHQIPVKLLQAVNYLDYAADNRFTVKLFSQTDEFIFRCNDDVAAINWVMTLKKFEDEAKGKAGEKEPSTGPQPTATATATNDGYPFSEEKKGSDHAQPQSSAVPERLTIRELRAMCHGADINTAGMERTELEAAAESVRRQGTYFVPPAGVSFPNIPMGQPASHPKPAQAPRPQSPPPGQYPHQTVQPSHSKESHPAPEPAPTPEPAAQPTQAQAPPEDASKKHSVKELRAICHGAGVNTAGMERGELQAAADKVLKRGTYFDPPPGAYRMPTASVPSAEEQRARQEEMQRQEALRAAKEEMKSQEELRARQEELRKHDELRAHQEKLRYQEELRRQELTRARQEELKRQEELRRKQDQELAERQRREAEEARRRQMEEERRRAEHQATEQQRRYAEQQAAWLGQQQEEMKRRHAAEQHATEQRRRHEEAMRSQQRWAGQQAQQQQWSQQQSQQQWHQQHPQQNNPFNQHNQPPPGSQQHNWQQQQAHHQQNQQTPLPQQHYQQQQHPNNQRHSAADDKYAKMANQNEDDGQATVTRIKHDLLIHWALQPPQLQMLRPVDVLVTTIHKVFPPALGVATHDYFTKWKPIDHNGLLAGNGMPDEDKLKKAVRKVRFFLHPDKLPKDLTPEQQFMTKMLWDVTSDAWEEFEKSKEALDWIK
jgi:hypothetical protein